MDVPVVTPVVFFSDMLGMFIAFLLEFCENPLFQAVMALAAVLGCIRLALYLFGA